mgnify:CR=1 FL=1
MNAERAQRTLARAAGELDGMLRAFHGLTGCHAAVWTRPSPSAEPVRRAASCATPPRALPDAPWPVEGRPVGTATAEGAVLLAAVPAVPRTCLVVGPAADRAPPAPAYADFLAPIVARQLQAVQEVEQAAEELGERYEEINLLYTISEIVGRAVSVEETAATILTEVSETVGARRASILLHDRVTDTLTAVAALGARPEELAPIAVDDPASISARVFRTLHPTIAAPEEPGSAAEAPYRDGALLSVPIVWSSRERGEPLGVVNLSGRRFDTFRAGDLKLVTAIASQIAAAIQNARLVRSSLQQQLQQQRLAQEMALAHDLQMKLLPRVDVVATHADVAARVVPAESVGGDFYHLFDLGGGRTGVLVGDVSSHGYRAALIMALAMSAMAIHARGSSSDPAATLGAVLGSLGEELTSTEMFISAFYAVVDPCRGELRYANAGHPHAFLVGADGTLERLPAGGPPLGMVDAPPPVARRPWRGGSDLLLLFTDGVSDANDAAGRRLGEQPVLEAVRAAREGSAGEVLRRVFDVLDAHTGDTPLRDDLTLVVLRSRGG